MPFDSQLRSKKATVQTRNSHGQFAPLKSSVKSSVKSSGSGNFIGNLFRTEKAADDESLVSLKVGNPLGKITKLLQDIKNRQATTVSMRFTIPLIALPIVFLLAFQLGRGQSMCHEYQSSIIGTVRNVTVTKQPEGNFYTNLISFLPFFPKPSETINQPVLVTENGEVVTLESATGIRLENPQNQVIATGKYSSCNKTLTIPSAENITRF